MFGFKLVCFVVFFDCFVWWLLLVVLEFCESVVEWEGECFGFECSEFFDVLEVFLEQEFFDYYDVGWYVCEFGVIEKMFFCWCWCVIGVGVKVFIDQCIVLEVK